MSRRRAVSAAGWIALAVIGVLPLVTLATQAVATQWFFPDLRPREWTLDGLERLVSDGATRSALVDSLAVGIAVTVLSMALAIPAARALALGRRRRPGLIGIVLLMPTALPPVAVAMGLSVAFLRAGVTGGYMPVVVAHLVATLPYAVLVLAAALTRYDITFERQAALLGAPPWRVLSGVFVPLATPALLVTAALAFVVSWSQYLLTLLPGGGDVVTLPVLLLASSGGGNPTLTSALAIGAAVPPAVALLLVLRHLDAVGRPVSRG